mmetsp:Transcript_24398/g.60708  ORF Transcript_24398/g.60708 Transcript_24398/m.60708 type:complete len:211 (+) Transcript_24398:513-1145(+)
MLQVPPHVPATLLSSWAHAAATLALAALRLILLILTTSTIGVLRVWIHSLVPRRPLRRAPDPLHAQVVGKLLEQRVEVLIVVLSTLGNPRVGAGTSRRVGQIQPLQTLLLPLPLPLSLFVPFLVVILRLVKFAEFAAFVVPSSVVSLILISELWLISLLLFLLPLCHVAVLQDIAFVVEERVVLPGHVRPRHFFRRHLSVDSGDVLHVNL